MYFVGILIFSAFLVALSFFSGSASVYVDLPSLIVILALTIPILLASGLLPDLFRGFRLMGMKVNPYSSLELKRITQACRLALLSLLLSGLTGTIFGTVGMLSNLSDPTRIGPKLAIAMLTTLYAIVLGFLILPVQAKVRTILDTMV